MNEQEFAELSAGYALNALSPDDRAAFETALAAHPEWSDLVSTDAATAAALADAAAPTAPPLTLRSTLLAKISTLPQGDAADAPAATEADVQAEIEPEPFRDPSPTTTTLQTVSRRNWTRGLFGLAASLVLLVGLGVGAVSLNEFLNRSDAVIALDQIEDAPDAQSATVDVAEGGTATAHWSESLGKVVLVSNGLPAIASGETFEMWFVREDGSAVSGGTFAAGTASSTTELLDGAFEAGDTIAVTVEQSGGSTTGAPTTEPIVIIPTA